MKFTEETLKKTCEEYKICGENQEKLVKEFFADYPDVELNEEKHNHDVEKSVDYSSKKDGLILKFEAPTFGKGEEEHINSLGKAYFHGKKFDHILLETGHEDVLPHGHHIVSHNHKTKEQWCEKIKSVFGPERLL